MLPIASGGTNKGLTLDAGGIFYSDADSFEVLGAGSSGSLLTSGAQVLLHGQQQLLSQWLHHR